MAGGGRKEASWVLWLKDARERKPSYGPGSGPQPDRTRLAIASTDPGLAWAREKNTPDQKHWVQIHIHVQTQEL